jgi:hypothetical protein
MSLNLATDRLVFNVPQSTDLGDTSSDQVTRIDSTPIERSGSTKIAVAFIQILLFECGRIPDLVCLFVLLDVPELH